MRKYSAVLERQKDFLIKWGNARRVLGMSSKGRCKTAKKLGLPLVSLEPAIGLPAHI